MPIEGLTNCFEIALTHSRIVPHGLLASEYRDGPSPQALYETSYILSGRNFHVARNLSLRQAQGRLQTESENPVLETVLRRRHN